MSLEKEEIKIKKIKDGIGTVGHKQWPNPNKIVVRYGIQSRVKALMQKKITLLCAI
jgi:hypothetical protein